MDSISATADGTYFDPVLQQKTETAFREDVVSCSHDVIERVKLVCQLDPAQLENLQLAAEGDVVRFYREYERITGVSNLFGECMVDLEEADRIFFGTDLSKHVQSIRQYPWTLSLARYPLDSLENKGKGQQTGSPKDADR